MKVLAINPGSTSTKIAVYEDDKEVFIKTLRHTSEELKGFEKITDEFSFRKDIIIKEVKEAGIDLHELNAIIGRGGLVKPIPSGIYEVNDKMKADLIESPLGEHASNLGGLIADDIAKELGGEVKAYIVDPVVVDELQDVARIAGHPLFERRSIFHALNQKAIGRTHAAKEGKKYEEMNLIIAHLGGGISVGAHEQGRVIDVNNALDGDGPFSPERSGTLPTGQLVNLCFSGKYSKKEVKLMLKGKGGLVAHCGTNSAYEVEKKAQAGDKDAMLIEMAMAYQVAKSCGAMAAALKGNVDAIILTGGIAYNNNLVEYIRKHVEFIAPLAVFPGEDEMGALAMNGMMVLKGEITAKEY